MQARWSEVSPFSFLLFHYGGEGGWGASELGHEVSMHPEIQILLTRTLFLLPLTILS